ncbi:MAG: hypothetical protein Q9226_002255 [Calogaya cf. arnoldii]
MGGVRRISIPPEAFGKVLARRELTCTDEIHRMQNRIKRGRLASYKEIENKRKANKDALQGKKKKGTIRNPGRKTVVKRKGRKAIDKDEATNKDEDQSLEVINKDKHLEAIDKDERLVATADPLPGLTLAAEGEILEKQQHSQNKVVEANHNAHDTSTIGIQGSARIPGNNSSEAEKIIPQPAAQHPTEARGTSVSISSTTKITLNQPAVSRHARSGTTKTNKRKVGDIEDPDNIKRDSGVGHKRSRIDLAGRSKPIETPLRGNLRRRLIGVSRPTTTPSKPAQNHRALRIRATSTVKVSTHRSKVAAKHDVDLNELVARLGQLQSALGHVSKVARQLADSDHQQRSGLNVDYRLRKPTNKKETTIISHFIQYTEREIKEYIRAVPPQLSTHLQMDYLQRWGLLYSWFANKYGGDPPSLWQHEKAWLGQWPSTSTTDVYPRVKRAAVILAAKRSEAGRTAAFHVIDVEDFPAS